MVEKLSVEVGLEGGEQVQRELSALEQGFVNAGLAVRDFAATVTQVAATAGFAAIAAGAAALIKYTNAVEETSKALTQLQKVSGATFQNLSEMQQIFSSGGTALNKFATEFGNLSEKIAAAGQQVKIRNADKEWVQWKNDIESVARQFDNLANGARVTFSVLTTLDTKVKALLESLSKARTPQEQWLKLADVFKNLSSDIERAQIGKALGLSPETIATLSQGSARIKELEAEAQRLGLTLTTSNQQALLEMAQGWNQFTTLLSAAFQKIAAAAAPAFAQLLEISKTVLAGIVTDFQTLPLDQALSNLGNRLAPAFNAISAIISPIMIQMGTALGTAFVQAIQSAVSAAVGQIFSNLGQELQTNLNILLENIRRLAANLGLGGGGGGPSGAPPQSMLGSEAFAGGGFVGGIGNGTSDSNLAWVSRGEHIMPAYAVAQPGVLAFLEALRRSGGNLRDVLDGMGRFALGGLVRGPIPAFAGGGLNAGMSHVTIQFPNLPPVTGLRASSSVIDELRRSAALAQVRSGGRKPSRYS